MKKIIIAIWNYFKSSWEGDDGEFSYKRASQFIFVWLMIKMIMLDKITSKWDFYVFLVLAILFALTATIITVPQLLKMMKYYSKSNIGIKDTESDKEDNVPTGQLPT